MSNPIFDQMNTDSLMQRVQQLKTQIGGDPNDYIQKMLNSGRITQDQYNQAVQRVKQLQTVIKI